MIRHFTELTIVHRNVPLSLMMLPLVREQEDIDLLWIADEALQAEDPEGWEQCESPNGDMYYMHSVTKQVLWQHPLDYTYQQKYLAAKAGTTQKSEEHKAQAAPMRDAPHATHQPARAASFMLPKDVSAVSEQVTIRRVRARRHAEHNMHG